VYVTRVMYKNRLHENRSDKISCIQPKNILMLKYIFIIKHLKFLYKVLIEICMCQILVKQFFLKYFKIILNNSVIFQILYSSIIFFKLFEYLFQIL